MAVPNAIATGRVQFFRNLTNDISISYLAAKVINIFNSCKLMAEEGVGQGMKP
jgi:hypothetical protein